MFFLFFFNFQIRSTLINNTIKVKTISRGMINMWNKKNKSKGGKTFEGVMHKLTINENFDICQTQNFHAHVRLLN